MSDAAAILRQRARLFAEQQKKRAAAVRANGAAPPSADSDTRQQQSAPSHPTGVKRESVADLFASAASNGGETAVADMQHSRHHKRPPPTLDESPVESKKLKTAVQPPAPPVVTSSSAAADVDPLDAYIAILRTTLPPATTTAAQPKPATQPTNMTAASSPTSFSTTTATRERYYADDEGALDEDELDRLPTSATTSSLDDPTKRLKRKQLDAIDHSTVHYIDIRKDFWIESPDITRLTDDEVADVRREELEGVKIRGKRCPRPFLEWRQCGLLEAVMDVIRGSGYTKPFPIQAQAIPAIMSGRDVIACAKTGSGKCFARGTRLRLVNGDCVAVEDVVGGEQLMGDDGLPRTVTPGSLTHGIDTLYRITPTWEGAQPFVVNAAHILVLVNDVRPYVRPYRSMWAAVEWEVTTEGIMRQRVSVYATQAEAQADVAATVAPGWETLEWEPTVEQFLQHDATVQRSCQLVACQPITFINPQLPSLRRVLTQVLGKPCSTAQLEYMAWWLGMWLSYGSDKHMSLLRYGMFAQILTYMGLFDESGTERADKPFDVDCIDFDFRGEGVASRVLHRYGLIDSKHKHIPRALICDSATVRQGLLAGLIDGAGWYDRGYNRFDIACQHLNVISGCKELAATLGLRNGAVSDHSCTDKYTGQRCDGHRVSVSGNMWDVLRHCSFTDKQSVQPSAADYIASNIKSRCYGLTVAELPAGEYFGFAVHGGCNRRFLLDDYTVTHNTLAYLLPLLRHVKDQPQLEEGEGPIGLILGPTRELAVQVYTEAKKFAKAVGLRVVCVYGGSGVAEQIAGLKRGSDVIVATPGRLIDMLCANNGRVLSLYRTSFVVLDEADRMFDMGFEPQITKVLQLIRPDRQLVMFSATFPASIEKLARKTLKDGLEIVIGGRSVASDTVTQYVEVRKAEDKWPRLLEILGQWYTKGSIIVFVDKQEVTTTHNTHDTLSCVAGVVRHSAGRFAWLATRRWSVAR